MNIFWNIYCHFYALTLKIWLPYRALLDDIIEKLKISDGDSILDAGCGFGAVIEAIIKRNKNVRITGLDSSTQMLKYANNKCKSFKNVTIAYADLNQHINISNASFNKIVCNNVLYALEEPVNALSEFYRLLQPHGMLILSNPKPNAQSGKLFQDQWKRIYTLKPFYMPYLYTLLFILSSPAGAVVALMNMLIVKKAKSGGLAFLTKAELDKVLMGVGFRNVTYADTYAGQNYLITAVK